MYNRTIGTVKRTGGASVFGLYPEFQGLRTGSLSLRHLGFSVRDVSFLFTEAAISLPPSMEMPCVARSHSIGALIGGTVDSLDYIHVRNSGVITAAIMTVGMPRYEAEEYESAIQQGKLLICARSFSSASTDLAMQALLGTGAEHIVAVPRSSATSQPSLSRDFHWIELKPLFEANLVC